MKEPVIKKDQKVARSVRFDADLLEQAKELKISVSAVCRNALQQAVLKRKRLGHG